MSKRAIILVLAAAVLVPPHAAASSDPGPSFFLGGGATGTSAFGYRGGWGLGGGVALPIARGADFLVRAEYHAVPVGPEGEFGSPVHIAMPAWPTIVAELGRGPGGAERAALVSAMLGVRLHAPAGFFQSYLDALVGVGHMRDRERAESAPGANGGRLEIRDDTNVALSFGGGVKLVPTRLGSLFADVHYDFYFVPAADTPIIPIRLGVSTP